jgi:hypothetical protein
VHDLPQPSWAWTTYPCSEQPYYYTVTWTMKLSPVSALCCCCMLFFLQPSYASNGFQNPIPNTFVREVSVIDKNSKMDILHHSHTVPLSVLTNINVVLTTRGGSLIPAGYNPFGYKITALGEQFLEIHKNCLESDVGRFIASLKSKRKTFATLQQEWLEIVRVSKSGQIMRIYRTMKDMIEFCLAARLID